MSDKYPGWSPFAYCLDNPIMIVDHDGRETDWVRNLETGEYQWMDNVQKAEDAPEGLKYIGPSDNDILTDLNIPPLSTVQKTSTRGWGVAGDDGKKGGAPTGNINNINGYITAKSSVSYSKSFSSQNNKEGRRFEGIIFEGHLNYRSHGSNSDLVSKYQGVFSLKINSTYYSEILSLSTGLHIEGTLPLQSIISVPASIFMGCGPSIQANIKAGTLNPGLIRSPAPVSFNWIFGHK